MNFPRKNINLSAVLVLLTLLISCQLEADTATPTSTETPFPSATSTRIPTEKIWPTKLPTATENPFLIAPPPTNLPTEAPISNYLYNGSLSPNGKWVAYTIGLDLWIYHVNGSLVWKIPHLYQIGQYGWLAWREWSLDSQYFYFSTSPSYGGGPFYDLLHNGDGIWKLDLLSGEVTEVLEPSYDGGSEHRLRSLALTRDRSKLAYSNTLYEPFELVVLDFGTLEQEARFTIADGYYNAGNLLWSPDNSKILFTAMSIAEYAPDERPIKVNYHLYLLDVDKATQTKLLDLGWDGAGDLGVARELLQLKGWESNHLISFHIKDVCGRVSLFHIDKKQFVGEVLPAATPRPVFWPILPTPVGDFEPCPTLPTPTSFP